MTAAECRAHGRAMEAGALTAHPDLAVLFEQAALNWFAIADSIDHRSGLLGPPRLPAFPGLRLLRRGDPDP